MVLKQASGGRRTNYWRSYRNVSVQLLVRNIKGSEDTGASGNY